MARISGYSKPQRLVELELGTHARQVDTLSTKFTAPDKDELVHTQRLSAQSLSAKNETGEGALGAKPGNMIRGMRLEET